MPTFSSPIMDTNAAATANETQANNGRLVLHPSFLPSPETLAKIEQKRSTHQHRRATSIFFHTTNQRYSWLLPCWLVEERRMVIGRIYRVNTYNFNYTCYFLFYFIILYSLIKYLFIYFLYEYMCIYLYISS